MNSDISILRKAVIMAVTDGGGVGPKMFQQLLMRLGAPEDFLNASESDFEDIPRLTKKKAENILSAIERVDEYSDRLTRYIKTGFHITTYLDDNYPDALRRTDSPPPVIYARGEYSLVESDLIAIVGTSSATQPGIRLAVDLSKELVKRDYGIISGLAIGIDSAAHLGALKDDGKTVAVLGCGLNKIYPKENIPLSESILSKGGLLISEHDPEKRISKSGLITRNRLISALSKAVIVAEIGIESKGELKTAKYALEQAKPIFYGDPENTLDYKSTIESPGIIIKGIENINEILKYII